MIIKEIINHGFCLEIIGNGFRKFIPKGHKDYEKFNYLLLNYESKT